jgi:hypothetical protein
MKTSNLQRDLKASVNAVVIKALAEFLSVFNLKYCLGQSLN